MTKIDAILIFIIMLLSSSYIFHLYNVFYMSFYKKYNSQLLVNSKFPFGKVSVAKGGNLIFLRKNASSDGGTTTTLGTFFASRCKNSLSST